MKDLEKEIIEGRMIEGFKGNKYDKMEMEREKIYVKKRREESEMRKIIVDINKVKREIMKSIRKIGDVEEDEDLLKEGEEGVFDINKKIGNEERIMLMERMISKWREQIKQNVSEILGVDDVQVKEKKEDEIWIERDMEEMMDKVEKEGEKWRKIKRIEKDDIEEWWRVKIGFIDIVKRIWKDIMDERRM